MAKGEGKIKLNFPNDWILPIFYLVENIQEVLASDYRTVSCIYYMGKWLEESEKKFGKLCDKLPKEEWKKPDSVFVISFRSIWVSGAVT